MFVDVSHVDPITFASVDQLASINELTGAVIQAPLAQGVGSLVFEPPAAITPASIQADVRDAFAKGLIHSKGLEHSMLDKLAEAAAARANGNCREAADEYRAFIRQVNKQSGKQIDAATASLLAGEAQFLIAHCP